MASPVPLKFAADSSTPGFLAPGPVAPFAFDNSQTGFDAGRWDGGEPLDDDQLEDFFQRLVAGITGLEQDLVRPRWQPEPPNQPEYDVTWCGLGVVNYRPETFAWVGHSADGDQLLRQEEIELLLTFYGPHGHAAAAQLRDGLQIGQNRDMLWAADMGLVECTDIGITAEFVKQQWIGRADLRLIVRRQVRRLYPVLDLASAQGRVTGLGHLSPAGSAPHANFDTAIQKG